MKAILETMNRRMALLEKAIKRAEKDKSTFPEGRLRISKTAGQVRFYVVSEKNSDGEYLSVKDARKVKILAQKDYNRQFLKAARAELELLEKSVSKCAGKEAEAAFEHLKEERKELVNPYILSNDQFAREWQSIKFNPNPYKPEKRIFDTRRGEKVRSKSEAIIADILYEYGIPYHYEYPVKMANGIIKYPDFTLLKVKTREVIYFEHFGRMDEEIYRQDTREKMDLYRDTGIYPGKNMMFTYETRANPLDIKGVRKMLAETML